MRLRSCLIFLATAAWPAATSLSAQQRPELFGPGIFSTGAWDFFVAFTPDQRTAYFCRANGDFTLSYQEMQRRLTGIGNGLGDIYRIPLSDLGIPPGK